MLILEKYRLTGREAELFSAQRSDAGAEAPDTRDSLSCGEEPISEVTSDAAKLSRGNFGSDGILAFRQTKTGGMAFVPWTNSLPDYALDWGSERECVVASAMATAGFTFLETTQGKARSVKGLSNYLRDSAVAAGISERTAHGLRKYRLTMMAESGATAHAIMAWGGHTSLSEAEKYTRAASKKALVSDREQKRGRVNAI